MAAFLPVEWRVRTRTLDNADHTLVMGVLNVTPDSFSDGDRFAAGVGTDTERAVAAGLAMFEAGADIVDVGGESTRPGSTGVAAGVEAGRVVPVVEALAQAGVVVSIDTRKPDVAADALAAGAEIVNDITALSHPAMVEVCADTGCGVVLMHMQGEPATMQDDPRYDDVVTEVADQLADRVAVAIAGGVDRSRICVDPGIGFGKTFTHNLDLLAGLDRLIHTGFPVLVGPSRKGFLGTILESAGRPVGPERRDAATGAAVALAIASGVAVIRVHDVAAGLQVGRTADAIVRHNGSGTSGRSTN